MNQYSPQHTIPQKIPTKTWQSHLKDHTKITQLSIPGTHDSAAYHSPHTLHRIFTSFFWKTQQHDIKEQLRKGIRFFDIRIKCQEGEKLSLYHGPIYLGQFDRIIGIMTDFLKKRKSQFIVLMFQKQQGTQNCVSSGKKIISQIMEITKNEVQIFKFGWESREIPCVGDLRGKFWLIQAYPGQKNRVDLTGHFQIPTYCSTHTLTDNKTYIIQNFWQGPQKKKKQQILKVLNIQHKHLLKFNFLIESNLPKFYCDRYNGWFEKIILEKKMKNLGIVVLDFPGDGVIQAIIRSNF